MRLMLLSFLLIGSAFAADIEEDNGVLVLTTNNFKDAIKENEFILVEFYAPWCGHCKSLAPEYEKAAGSLKKSDSKIKLAKVDATVEKDLASEYQVQGYPTLKFFKNGDALEYSGPREADGIVAWLEKKTGPPALEVASLSDAEKLIEDKEVLVMGFFADQDSKEAKAFLAAADADDENTYAITSDEETFKKFDVSKKGIILFKKFDDKRVDFDGKFKKSDITDFVAVESTALVTEFSAASAQKLFGTAVKKHLLYVGRASDKKHESNLDALRKVAKPLKGEMIFVFVDADKSDNDQVLEFFDLGKDQLPSYLIYEMESSAKYIAGKKESIEESEVQEFVDNYKNGKLERSFKSEEVPKDWDSKPVKVLVGKNFEEVALDKTKDVFVEFYAPWCGHCKQLAPKWDELGEKFKDHESIVIAKMDSTANEVADVSIQGFPTLKLFKKETNEIVDYNGAREVADMAKFLEAGGNTSDAEEDDEEEEEADTKRDEL